VLNDERIILNMKISFEDRDLYRWAQDLYPICRSLTGDAVRETLGYIKNLIPELTVHSIKSGERVNEHYFAEMKKKKLTSVAYP
jgi:aminopeptidase-like protein